MAFGLAKDLSIRGAVSELLAAVRWALVPK